MLIVRRIKLRSYMRFMTKAATGEERAPITGSPKDISKMVVIKTLRIMLSLVRNASLGL